MFARKDEFVSSFKQNRKKDEIFSSIIQSEISVEDADGGFFESFTALSWKQENRRLQMAQEDEKGNDKELTPPPEIKSGVKVPNFKIAKEEIEKIYVDVIYTILHRIQMADERDVQHDLIEFVNNIFDFNSDMKAKFVQEATEIKSPSLILNVTVLEAQGLEAKDSNGFSDPYCMLGIQPGSNICSGPIPTIVEPEQEEPQEDDRQDKPKRSHGFRLSFKRKDRGDGQHKEKEKEKYSQDNLVSAIPAILISATSVQPATLNPKWNEKFKFDVADISSDNLHLDIWDHDDESSVLEAVKKLNEISTWKGLGRYFKQIAQSARMADGDNIDDFLGSVNVPLKSISSTGVEKWYALQARTHRSNIQGRIRLLLHWSVREDPYTAISRNSGKSFEQHEKLFRIFIDHELRNYKYEDLYSWDGELPVFAQSILRQHAILGDLNQLRQVMCQWVAFSRKHMELSLNYTILYKILDQLNNHWASDILSGQEEEMLAESFNLFIEFCLSLLRKQRDLFPPTNKAALIKLEYLLRCLALIQSMQAFWQCCPFHKELPLEVINIVRKGTREWYDKMVALTKPETVNEESLTTSFIELTNIVTADIQRGFQYYNKIFEDILNISYFSVIYKQLDVLLTNFIGTELSGKMTDDVAPVVMELCATLRKLQVTSDEITDHDLQMGTHMFELYMALQEFFKFKNNLTQEEQAKLHILNYAQWFSEVVNRWLIIARYKAMLRIRRAVELEKVVSQVDSLVKHSTSAVDTTSCFYQIKIFWKQLAWPDLLSAYVFVTKILDDICCGATYYADLMYTKLYEAGFYDEDGQFDVTEQLCIAINDMEHVRSSLRILPQELEFEAIIQAVDKSQGEVGGRQCRVAFESVLSSAIEDVENQIFKVVGHIGEKMRPDIRKYAFHLAWAPDGLPAEEAIVPLMEYLDNNLTTLNGTLLSSNFERILIIIWSVVMEEVQTQADSGIGEKHLVFFERLHGSLTIMMDFFHAEEKGLSLEMLKNQQYQKCQRFLSLNRTETLDLISKYYFEKLMEQQKNTSCENGVLTVRVYFHNDCLCIEVISAKDILPLDTNGYSDPFVILQILPPRIFPNCPIQSTKVQKKTLQPVFDEIFEYSATLEQCKDPSSMIQLTVMDHDILLSNDFAGEAFVSLNHVPGVDEKMVEDVATLHGLKPIELNLLRSKQSENEILKVLEKRLWDKTALEFAKSQKAHSA